MREIHLQGKMKKCSVKLLKDHFTLSMFYCLILSTKYIKEKKLFRYPFRRVKSQNTKFTNNLLLDLKAVGFYNQVYFLNKKNIYIQLKIFKVL